MAKIKLFYFKLSMFLMYAIMVDNNWGKIFLEFNLI